MDAERVYYAFRTIDHNRGMPGRRQDGRLKFVRLKGHCGPGDRAEPA